MNGHERTVRGAAVTWYVHPDGSRRIALLGDDITVAVDDVQRFDTTNAPQGAAVAVQPAPDPAPAPDEVQEQPPRAGKGSSRAAWAAYAATVGVTVDDGMSRDDITKAVDDLT